MLQDVLITFISFDKWQDIVIAAVSLMFGIILLPQLKDVWHGKTILNLYTASLTTIGLFILVITFFTMGFWISFIADFFSGIIWFLLFILSVRNIKKEKQP
jgi:hypothetical protein